MKTLTYDQALEYARDAAQLRLPQTHDHHPVMYEQGKTHIVTILREGQLGQLVSQYGGDNITELGKKHPDAVVTTMGDAWASIEDLNAQEYSQPWHEIDRERYWEMLEILPPEHWVGDCFRMSEYMTANYTNHFIKIAGRYFEGVREAVRDYTPYREEIIKQFKIGV